MISGKFRYFETPKSIISLLTNPSHTAVSEIKIQIELLKLHGRTFKSHLERASCVKMKNENSMASEEECGMVDCIKRWG